MLLFFKQNPFVRLLLPLVIGIWVGIVAIIPYNFLQFLTTITVVASISLIGLDKQSANYKTRWIFGFNVFAILFIIGILLVSTKEEFTKKYVAENTHPQLYTGTIFLPPEQRTKSVQCFIETKTIMNNGKWLIYNTKILAYLKKDSSSLHLKAGDLLVFKAIVSNLKPSGNPHEFDYSKYLYYQSVFYSAYINHKSWKILTHNGLHPLLMWSYKLRDKLLNLFSKIGMKGDEYAVASALTIGDKANLDAEIKRAYISSGAMHILAVSGMHVGLLYWVTNLFLSFFNRIKHGKYFKLVILFFVIWMYALITGMSASVLRATVMFSFVIAGQASSRKINIFNSLAASAFFLLLWNPYNLVDAGFQLSYLAVLSIVTLYPLIYKLLVFENWTANQIWSITACTLAAQIGTFPLSIYYFHQFPNLFLISNLIIIPFSTLIIYYSILLIISFFSEVLLNFLGYVFNWLVWALNKIVLYIDQLPFALWKGLYINQFEMVIIFAIIIACTLFLVQKQIVFLRSTLVFVLLLVGSKFFTSFQYIKKQEVVFYNYQKNTVFQFRNGQSSVWLVDSIDDRIKNMIKQTSYAELIRDVTVLKLDSVIQATSKLGKYFGGILWIKGSYIQVKSKRIFIPDKSTKLISVDNKLPVDYVVMRNTIYKPNNIQNFIAPKTIIFDGTVAKYKVDKITKYVVNKGITVYSMANSGAIKLQL